MFQQSNWKEPGELKPAELAYLAGRGDMTHTLLVMIFDLVHRVLKTNWQECEFAPYEKEIALKIKDHLQAKATEKVAQVLPMPKKKETAGIGLIFFAWRVYQFVWQKLRHVVAKVINDPLHLKKYFSPTVIMRLLAEIFGSGLEEIVGRELESDMQENQLLLRPEQVKKQSAFQRRNLSLGALGLGAFACILPFFFLTSLAPWPAIACIIFFSALNALLFRTIWFLRKFIPLYSEVKDVLEHVKRDDIRLVILRLVISFVTWALRFSFAFSSLFVLFAEVLIFKYAWALDMGIVALSVTSLTFSFLSVLELLLRLRRLDLGFTPTREANRLVLAYKKKLENVSPFETFKNVLLTKEYDPQFSEILALYGIETLWLLI